MICGRCCTEAELFAQYFCCGSKKDGGRFEFITENKAVARRILHSLKDVLKIEASVSADENRFKDARTYTVSTDGAAKLNEIVWHDPKLGLPAGFNKKCCRLAIIRGAFLGGGTVSDPKKNYHLEFVSPSSGFARLLADLLASLKIRAKIVTRKHSYVIYLNEGDSIAALLALTGAHSSILDMENIRAYKETRNNVNRAVNCETANINKTVEAAITQLNSIRAIDERMGISKLSPPLLEAAQLRLSNPHASLNELCEICGATKSGMNHRLRKLNTIAKTLTREELQ